MKRFLQLFLTASVMAVILTSCDDNIIWDFACYDVAVRVIGENGDERLDPGNPNRIPTEKIKLTYRDKVYDLLSEGTDGKYGSPKYGTKALPPEWHGFRIEYSEYLGEWPMLFGEFSPSDDHRKEKLVIDWGDGTQDAIEFDLWVWYNLVGRDPKVQKKLYLNGVPQPAGSLRLTLVK